MMALIWIMIIKKKKMKLNKGKDIFGVSEIEVYEVILQ